VFLGVLVIIGLATAASLLRGGSLVRIAEIPLRGLVPLLVAAGLQAIAVLVIARDTAPEGLWSIFLASNLLVGVCLFLNRRLPGVALLITGLAMNAVVTLLNGGMPTSAAAAEIASMDISSSRLDAEHVLMGPDTVLAPFGDVVPIPNGHLVISLGDLLLAAGVARFIYASSQPGATRFTGYGLRVPAEGGET
jgi:Family of unknown function (DUF5317)